MKKSYSVIQVKQRIEFIKNVLMNKQSVKKAAQSLNLKFSTAKTILKIFKTEGRVGKKKFRKKIGRKSIFQKETSSVENERGKLQEIAEELSQAKKQVEQHKSIQNEILDKKLNTLALQEPVLKSINIMDNVVSNLKKENVQTEIQTVIQTENAISFDMSEYNNLLSQLLEQKQLSQQLMLYIQQQNYLRFFPPNFYYAPPVKIEYK